MFVYKYHDIYIYTYVYLYIYIYLLWPSLVDLRIWDTTTVQNCRIWLSFVFFVLSMSYRWFREVQDTRHSSSHPGTKKRIWFLKIGYIKSGFFSPFSIHIPCLSKTTGLDMSFQGWSSMEVPNKKTFFFLITMVPPLKITIEMSHVFFSG